ncbi:MAG: YhdH/YhfP family quinone oxidoreductase [Bacteroidales bacterium]|nr:YhdH/YhfP family quinone oxidoreductase [Bacteroidales bacterium]
MDQQFKCYEVLETSKGFNGVIKVKSTLELPDNEVLIRVLYSGLNYKDALSANGHKGVTKNYPHTPGIDAAGIVESSNNTEFHHGQQVIVTSYDLGMNTAGGFGQYISVPGNWIVPLPSQLSLRESMVYGTAGLTAAQGIHSMITNGQTPEMGPILVTGARGAVGGMAIMILDKLGFETIAGVSKISDDTEHLKSIGAASVIDSDQTNDNSSRVLMKPKWAGAFDVVGGNTLATILKCTSYGGNIVTVGNIESANLKTTVLPFILNGINLLGIGTQDTPMQLRKTLWNLLAGKWKPVNLEATVLEIGLSQLQHYINIMQTKKSRGRVLLNLNNDKK